MSFFSCVGRLRWPVTFLVATTLLITGCASHYVDTALKDVPANRTAQVKAPRPVQLLFEFQTKGATNSRATDNLKKRATELVTNSKLFSVVSPEPVAGGSVLSIVVNNIPLTSDVAAKGFVTGLTFGLAGTAVTDGYVCTVDFLPGPTSPKITSVVRHAIHTTVGNAGAPANAAKAANIQEAVDTMFRQLVTNGLNNIASNPTFN